MTKRFLVVTIVLLLLFWGKTFTKVQKHHTITVLDKQEIVSPSTTFELRTACLMQKHDDTVVAFFSGFVTDDRIVTYFDPAVECNSPTYPFEIQSVSFPLIDAGGFQWPVDIDIVVFGLAGADSCAGPGAELCRFTVSCDSATFKLPHVGTATFPIACSLTGPVFVGIEYSDTGTGIFPSIIFDKSAPVPECDNWGFGVGSWAEWYDFWTGPAYPGYPIIWVQGETQSSSCCVGIRGDVNGDGWANPNVLDLNYLVNYIFRFSGNPGPCPEESDVNASGGTPNVLDLNLLVNYIFRMGAAPGTC